MNKTKVSQISLKFAVLTVANREMPTFYSNVDNTCIHWQNVTHFSNHKTPVAVSNHSLGLNLMTCTEIARMCHVSKFPTVY